MRDYLKPTDLKAVLHSKRANIYYLEKCAVVQKAGRVLYLTEGKGENQYYNIPVANTTVILLGTGTSITQPAMRMLAAAGVMVGFCGGGGTPIIAGTNVEWMTAQSEYRPTEYVQGWLSFWFDEEKRLAAAKNFQKKRIHYLEKIWTKDKMLQSEGIYADDNEIEKAIDKFGKGIDKAQSVNDLLSSEASFAKSLYRYAAAVNDIDNFSRDPLGGDDANRFLTHGNYLAYGLAATALWVLGIPHGFPLMHGKTRRGALVFDVADLIKDTLILPWAFVAARRRMSDQEFRELCLKNFLDHGALDYMFNCVKEQSQEWRKDGGHAGDI